MKTHTSPQDLRALQILPHVAQYTTNHTSAIDSRTTRHPLYATSKQKRKQVKEISGWLKTVGVSRKVKLRVVRRASYLFTCMGAKFNLARIRNLMERTA